MEKATFAAGCFWGVETLFRGIPGVSDAPVGYIGGHTENPTYRDVCSGGTDHAEAIEVTFDPAQVNYQTLLDVFWANHNPTTPNQQGPDIGSQYRSAVFYHSDKQKQLAEETKARLNHSGKFKRPIVTEIVPAVTFYRAEEYHQRYDEKHGRSCHI